MKTLKANVHRPFNTGSLAARFAGGDLALACESLVATMLEANATLKQGLLIDSTELPPRLHQDRRKIAPRPPQDHPKTTPNRPKTDPKPSPDRPKTAPRPFQDVPGDWILINFNRFYLNKSLLIVFLDIFLICLSLVDKILIKSIVVFSIDIHILTYIYIE